MKIIAILAPNPKLVFLRWGVKYSPQTILISDLGLTVSIRILKSLPDLE